MWAQNIKPVSKPFSLRYIFDVAKSLSKLERKKFQDTALISCAFYKQEKRIYGLVHCQLIKEKATLISDYKNPHTVWKHYKNN